MKIHSIFVAVLLLLTSATMAQKYMTKNGAIRFFSDAPLEKIEARNNQVNAALDIGTGNLVFKVLMKSFLFEKALMQEHFNENYVESDKYPTATFVGKIINLGDIGFTKDGSYEAQVEGKMTIHGVTKELKEKGILNIRNGKIMASTVFPLRLSDYDIKIPGTMANNISETVEITVEVTLDSLNP